MGFTFEKIWLQEALRRTIETHDFTVDHVVAWANRHALFDDVTFLIEGVAAWFDGDYVKSVNVLVPQIESGLRSIGDKIGEPVTKARRPGSGVGVSVGMGDILNSGDIRQVLGPDLILYFLALYADPRGMTLRNRVAHGLIKPEFVEESLVIALIHTLLVFGVWKELAERRR